MTRTIAITGGKGGVGKTNISVNLALCLATSGARVCLFDADLGLANINILLGLYPELTLEDVICGKKNIEDIIIRDYQGIDIIPGSSGVEQLANLDQTNIQPVIDSLSALDQYDFFIFDTSSGISKPVVSFCLCASEVILTLTPEPTALTDAYALLKVLSLNGFDGAARVVINQCKNTSVASVTYNKFKEAVQKYLTVDISPLGIIVHDRKVPEAVSKQRPFLALYPGSPASQCIRVMASRLLENEPEEFKTSGIASFWERFVNVVTKPLTLTEKKKPPVTVTPPDAAARRVEPRPPVQDTMSEPAVIETPSPGSTQRYASAALEDLPAGPSAVSSGQSNAATQPLLDKIEFSKNLPTLPHILLKLIELCGRPDVSVQEIGSLARKDPSLVTKILRMVNSAYYSLPNRIRNFDQAVSLLGIDAIRNVAFSASVYQVFNGLDDRGHFNLKHFWWHSLMCACLANFIAKKISYPMSEEAFLAGLLHDIGKLVLLQNYPETYADIFSAQKSGASIFGEEAKRIGVNHCDAGARLISFWQLQPFVSDAVLYHHEPQRRIAEALPLVKIVFVANSLCHVSQNADLQKHPGPELLGLEPSDIEEILQQAGGTAAQIAQSLDIEIEPPENDPDVAARDREVQLGLTRQVRDTSLLQGMLQDLVNAHDTLAIVGVARQGLRMLYDFKEVLFFLYDKEGNCLNAVADTAELQNDMIQQLKIPCEQGKSILARALRSGTFAHSFSYGDAGELTIMDEQLIRLLGSEGLVCLPLSVQKQYVGAVALGMNNRQLSWVTRQMRLLNMIVSYTALALHAENVRQSQAKLILAERLAASTALAKRVAHEVNNPLSIIKNYLKVLELNMADNNLASDEIKIIFEEIDRVSHIIDELTDFSRPRIHTFEPLDLNELLADIIKITDQSFKQTSISILQEKDADLPKVVTSKNGLKQVFINLLKNSAEALKEGGTITVATNYIQDSHAVRITISDNGPGLSDHVKARLFEPYVSTKGEEHTGLGLSIAHSIVSELNGRLSCTSHKGKGTSFAVVLPVTAQNATAERT